MQLGSKNQLLKRFSSIYWLIFLLILLCYFKWKKDKKFDGDIIILASVDICIPYWVFHPFSRQLYYQESSSRFLQIQTSPWIQDNLEMELFLPVLLREFLKVHNLAKICMAFRLHSQNPHRLHLRWKEALIISLSQVDSVPPICQRIRSSLSWLQSLDSYSQAWFCCWSHKKKTFALICEATKPSISTYLFEQLKMIKLILF